MPSRCGSVRRASSSSHASRFGCGCTVADARLREERAVSANASDARALAATFPRNPAELASYVKGIKGRRSVAFASENGRCVAPPPVPPARFARGWGGPPSGPALSRGRLARLERAPLPVASRDVRGVDSARSSSARGARSRRGTLRWWIERGISSGRREPSCTSTRSSDAASSPVRGAEVRRTAAPVRTEFPPKPTTAPREVFTTDGRARPGHARPGHADASLSAAHWPPLARRASSSRASCMTTSQRCASAASTSARASELATGSSPTGLCATPTGSA
jgi:hypothetical protein